MYETILLATDGSEGAQRATERALDIASERDATLHVLSVVDRRRWEEPALSSAELAVDAVENDAHARLESIRDRAEGQGIETDTRVSHGVPYEEIVEYAGEVDADAIVLGTRGEGEAPGLGSVAKRVVSRAPCTVLTV